jgi:predicted DNA-binding antitoxin AbrB/MazE fold protein
MAQLIRARFERGVLKPLQRLRLKRREICLVSVYPEAQWQRQFDALLTRVRKRASRYRSAAIEADITAARADVRAKRRATRRAV